MPPHSGLDILLGIAGGVALLLWATRMVRTGIERAYAASLRRTVARAMGGRVQAAVAGTGVGFALQSATAAALLTMSFVASGLLTTPVALAVMLGADVGSALAVLVLSLDLRWLSPLLLLIGTVLFLATAERRPRQLGRTMIGLGLILLSLRLIGESGAAMREAESLPALIEPLASEPALAFLVAALFAWVAHSSVATVLLVASLTGAHVIPVELAVTLVLGANAGAGLVPVVLSLRRERRERRIPLGNLGFRTVGALAVLAALPWILPLAAAEADRLGLGPVQRVVLFHLGFNLTLVVLFLPVVSVAARLAERWLPDRADPQTLATPLGNPSHLDERSIDQPRLALACATREVLRMADWVELMLRRSIDAFQTVDKTVIGQIERMDDQVDRMNNAIKHYLVQVSRNRLDEDESGRCMEIASFTVKLEHIGDIVEKNLLQLARKRIDGDRRFSSQGWTELTDLHARVLANLQLALNVFVSSDVETARQLVQEKDRFRALERASATGHLTRLREGTAASIDSSPIHLDVIRDLAQINSLLASTAYPILEESGDLLTSRLRHESLESLTTEREPSTSEITPRA